MKYFKKSYFSDIKKYKNYTLIRKKNKSNKNIYILPKKKLSKILNYIAIINYFIYCTIYN